MKHQRVVNGGTESSQISSKRPSFVFGLWTKASQVWKYMRVS